MTLSPRTVQAATFLARTNSFPTDVLCAQVAVLDEVIIRQAASDDHVAHISVRQGSQLSGMSSETWSAAMAQPGPWIRQVESGVPGGWEDGHGIAAGWEAFAPMETMSSTTLAPVDFIRPAHALWTPRTGLGRAAWRLALASATGDFTTAQALTWSGLSAKQSHRTLDAMKQRSLVHAVKRGTYAWNLTAVDFYDDPDWSRPRNSHSKAMLQQETFNDWHRARTAAKEAAPEPQQATISVASPRPTLTPEQEKDRCQANMRLIDNMLQSTGRK